MTDPIFDVMAWTSDSAGEPDERTAFQTDTLYVAHRREDGRAIALAISIQSDGSWFVELEEDGYTISDASAVLRPGPDHPVSASLDR